MAIVASHHSFFFGYLSRARKGGPCHPGRFPPDMTAMDGALAATDRWSFVMGWYVDVR